MRHITPFEFDCKSAQPLATEPSEALPGFDPRKYPIIARHVLGIEHTQSVGAEAAALVADLRFRNKMTVLLAMGERPIAEMVAEFAVRHGLETELDQVLDRYLELDVKALDAIGARSFPPPPLHEVG